MARFGLIIGSGMLDWPYAWDLCPGMDTEFGPASAALTRCEVGGHEIFAIARHGVPHRYAPHAVNYRANLTLLHRREPSAIVALNTVGGIAPFATTGALVVPDQIIDYTWGRAQSFCPDDAVRHIDFSRPYDARLRSLLLDAARGVHLKAHDGGIMGVTQGPRLETAAEISRMKSDGCAVVGMTAMPEAALARELDIPFACLSLVVNAAAGIGDEVLDLEVIAATSKRVMADAARLLTRLFETLERFD